MTTINIHKDKLLPEAFAYQQRKLKEILLKQDAMISAEYSRWFSLRHKSRFSAAKHLSRNSAHWKSLKVFCQFYVMEYVKLQTACRVAEYGIVSLDIDVVQRIFGEE